MNILTEEKETFDSVKVFLSAYVQESNEKKVILFVLVIRCDSFSI